MIQDNIILTAVETGNWANAVHLFVVVGIISIDLASPIILNWEYNLIVPVTCQQQSTTPPFSNIYHLLYMLTHYDTTHTHEQIYYFPYWYITLFIVSLQRWYGSDALQQDEANH
ncbi:hypothetical protein ACJX0J_025741 [Zea mays]